ncbi:MAG TPA: lysyl oxidase family protein [Nannocystaceae bacterium]|nr:lysyl oxidase family protein [Nannocystaceae bacterium]
MTIRHARPRVLFSILLALSACRDDGGGGTGDGGSSTGGSTGDEPASSSADDTAGESQGDSGDPGAPPPTPTLSSPADTSVDQPIQSDLCWNLVEDPDGDPVRYRVFLDGFQLEQGKGEAEGHEGPCLGPVDLVYEQTYSWTVQAFNPDFPTSQSDQSEPWSFTTESDGFTQTVFEDPFDDDLGWDVDGDADSGAWVRGDPVQTMNFADLSQPDNCGGGNSCYFTGQNPDAIVDAADVSGGSTTLTSPEFSLDGFVAASITLQRFFYKSDTETGTELRVELLTPDAEEPSGYRVFVLEELDVDVDDANMWTPKEYAACGLPMVAGSRLRIVATDLGDGIVEGAIDSVLVTGHLNDKLCSGGAGSLCDPKAASPCGDDLLCCAQGVINTGVFRCSEPVASVDYTDPPADPDAPNNGPLGCDAPDLFVEENALDIEEGMIYVANNDCVLVEGCVGGTGWRRVLTFTTQTPNAGSRDLTMGVPSNHPDLFHYSECHNHFHFDGYAVYELVNDDGVVATGHKQAFCLLDWDSWAWPGDDVHYSCSNQGISRGWYDEYYAYWSGSTYQGLDCQWIDITDVAPGTYTLRVAVNPPAAGTAVPPLVEIDYSNNVAEAQVVIE